MHQKYPILKIKPLTKNISQIFVKADKNFQYQPGQYVVIHHNHFHSSLSIANAPNEKHQLEFHLSHSSKNIEANHLLTLAEKEKEWQVEGPLGFCTIDKLQKQNKPIIFLTHGTGFAPIKAMIEMFANQKNNPPIYFYWSAFRNESFYMTDVLTDWQMQLFDFHFTLIAAEQIDNILELLARNHKNISGYEIYVSGPATFVHAAHLFLTQFGVAKENFHSDMV